MPGVVLASTRIGTQRATIFVYRLAGTLAGMAPQLVGSALYQPAGHRATVSGMNAPETGAEVDQGGQAVAATPGPDPPGQARVRQLAAEQELRELADTQAALRRLAMLVARGAPPEAVFAAATREALRYSGGVIARMIRYEPDGTATLLAREGTTYPDERVGGPFEGYPPTGLTATVLRTGQAARVDDYREMPGGERFRHEGLRSAVGTPIHVDGRLWGMIAVGDKAGTLPPDTEQRMTQFTDLVATAVANAQNLDALEASRDELSRLLAEQAALRRVATLVARGIDPVEIFSAVAGELGRLLDGDNAGISRFDPDGSSVVIVGRVGEDAATVPIGTRVEIPDYFAPAMVWRTGRSARIDEDVWDALPGPAADRLRKLGIRSMVASPIIVESRLWGVITVSSRRGPFPADAADRLADFTELLATAIGNAESRAELAASRARVVAAADAARRRIEALGGSLEVSSPPGEGTLISVQLPLPRLPSWDARAWPRT